MRKRITTVILAVVITLSVVATPLVLLRIKTAMEKNKDPSVLIERINKGQTRNLNFGKYSWRVLEVRNGRALLLTENVIESRAYEGKTWEQSKLRAYLNGEYLQKFTSEEQEAIAETRVRNPYNLWYNIPGGNDTYDKVFLLSIEEADRYFGDGREYMLGIAKSYSGDKYSSSDRGEWLSNQSNENRVAKAYSRKAHAWWLRSPGFIGAAVVDVDGGVYVCGYYDISPLVGVRPAIWIDLGDSGASSDDAETDELADAETALDLTLRIRRGIMRGNRRIFIGGSWWYVLCAAEKGKYVMLLAEDVSEPRKYNDELEDTTWESCSLRKYLNGEYLENFSSEELEVIIGVLNTNPDNPRYDTSGGNDTYDRVFLLSLEEIEGYLTSNEARMVKNSHAARWWLRSPGDENTRAAGVNSDGSVRYLGDDVNTDDGGIRPALWLDMKSEMFDNGMPGHNGMPGFYWNIGS